MRSNRRWTLPLLLGAVIIGMISACRSLAPEPVSLVASLRTDSAEIGVHKSGFGYFAKIGFLYVNTTPESVSKAGCRVPALPVLEKKIGDGWVAAYHPAYLMCLTKPDFMIESGGSYRGVVDFHAYEPGHNIDPVLRVDSIPGTYRLRWDFVKGRDATVEGGRFVTSTSNEFRMTLDRR